MHCILATCPKPIQDGTCPVTGCPRRACSPAHWDEHRRTLDSAQRATLEQEIVLEIQTRKVRQGYLPPGHMQFRPKLEPQDPNDCKAPPPVTSQAYLTADLSEWPVHGHASPSQQDLLAPSLRGDPHPPHPALREFWEEGPRNITTDQLKQAHNNRNARLQEEMRHAPAGPDSDEGPVHGPRTPFEGADPMAGPPKRKVPVPPSEAPVLSLPETTARVTRADRKLADNPRTHREARQQVPLPIVGEILEQGQRLIGHPRGWDASRGHSRETDLRQPPVVPADVARVLRDNHALNSGVPSVATRLLRPHALVTTPKSEPLTTMHSAPAAAGPGMTPGHTPPERSFKCVNGATLLTEGGDGLHAVWHGMPCNRCIGCLTWKWIQLYPGSEFQGLEPDETEAQRSFCPPACQDMHRGSGYPVQSPAMGSLHTLGENDSPMETASTTPPHSPDRKPQLPPTHTTEFLVWGTDDRLKPVRYSVNKGKGRLQIEDPLTADQLIELGYKKLWEVVVRLLFQAGFLHEKGDVHVTTWDGCLERYVFISYADDRDVPEQPARDTLPGAMQRLPDGRIMWMEHLTQIKGPPDIRTWVPLPLHVTDCFYPLQRRTGSYWPRKINTRHTSPEVPGEDRKPAVDPPKKVYCHGPWGTDMGRNTHQAYEQISYEFPVIRTISSVIMYTEAEFRSQDLDQHGQEGLQKGILARAQEAQHRHQDLTAGGRQAEHNCVGLWPRVTNDLAPPVPSCSAHVSLKRICSSHYTPLCYTTLYRA